MLAIQVDLWRYGIAVRETESTKFFGGFNMFNVIKEGKNATKITIDAIDLPNVSELDDLTTSAKGNKTFFYKRDGFHVAVQDGMYDVTVQVTAYVRESSIAASTAEKPKALPKDAVMQSLAAGLAASGFTPEDIAKLLVQLRKGK